MCSCLSNSIGESDWDDWFNSVFVACLLSFAGLHKRFKSQSWFGWSQGTGQDDEHYYFPHKDGGFPGGYAGGDVRPFYFLVRGTKLCSIGVLYTGRRTVLLNCSQSLFYSAHPPVSTAVHLKRCFSSVWNFLPKADTPSASLCFARTSCPVHTSSVPKR